MATRGERGRLSRGSRVPQAPEASTSDGRGPIVLEIVDDIVLKFNSCFARIRCSATSACCFTRLTGTRWERTRRAGTSAGRQGDRTAEGARLQLQPVS